MKRQVHHLASFKWSSISPPIKAVRRQPALRAKLSGFLISKKGFFPNVFGFLGLLLVLWVWVCFPALIKIDFIFNFDFDATLLDFGRQLGPMLETFSCFFAS